MAQIRAKHDKNIPYKNIKAIKRAHQVHLNSKNADRSAGLTVLFAYITC